MRCRTPKSARRRGSSRQERGRWENIRLGTDRQTDRQHPQELPPGTPGPPDSPVGRAVHGFEGEGLRGGRDREDVGAVVLPVP